MRFWASQRLDDTPCEPETSVARGEVLPSCCALGPLNIPWTDGPRTDGQPGSMSRRCDPDRRCPWHCVGYQITLTGERARYEEVDDVQR